MFSLRLVLTIQVKINIKLMKAHNQDYLTITQAKNE